MQVRFWGTRGSIAAPGPETLRYGGNTACVEVRTDDGTLLIFDCGTGARKLGLSLLGGGPVNAHLLLGHTHADHIQGLPFFVPAFLPGSQLTVYGPAGIDRDLPSAIGGQMEYAYFPVPLHSLPAKFNFVELGEGEFSIDEVHVRTQFLNHTAPNLGYRLDTGDASVVYATDHEPHTGSLWRPDRKPGEYEIEALLHPGDRRHAEFMCDADLVIHDAQYTLAEYPKRIAWGHSAVEHVIDLALAARVKHIVLFHHDPTRDDDALDAMLAQAKAEVTEATRESGLSMEVSMGTEGQIVTLKERERSLPTLTPHLDVQSPRTVDKPRILVADDDPAVRRVLETVLSQDGYEVVAVTNGNEALDAARAESFNLVMLDVQMPDLDGYQTCRALRADPRFKNVPIVILTSRTDREDMVTGFAEGATDYMAKPVAVSQVRARVRSWLSREVSQP
jgi:CheY-like chemotaxis protein/glyoxylase-like metal-dependent hydrolase (beta-lactamase superfamily II)